MSATAGQAQSARGLDERLGIKPGHVVQELGYDDDCDEQLRDAIAAENIMTAYGPIRFDQRGANIAKGMAVMQSQHGQQVVVYPPDAATGKPEYPLP